MISAALIAFFAIIIPALLVVLDAGNANAQSVVALCAGASAFSLMAINLFLATRPRIIEGMMGGLDQVYKAHKWIGITLLPLILFHKFVGMDLDGQIVASGLAKTAVDIAKIAFLVLLPLIILSWAKRLPKMRRDLIPYNIWRIAHRLLGVVFIALALHQLFVKVPFNGNALASQYLNVMAALGILSFLYTQLLAPFRPRNFTVTHVEKHPAATIIDVAPKNRGLPTSTRAALP